MFIPTPNFTQTPNDLIDHWLPRLGHAELKVLLVIIRKTFGWHKVRDRISLTQLQTITGLERRGVTRAVQGLVKKGLISKKVEGPKSAQVTYYELIIQEDSNNFTQCHKDTPPSVAATPTKETPTKEKKESSLTGAKEKGSAAPPPPPLRSFYEEKFENKIQITPEQRERLVKKYGGMDSLIDTYAEKLYRYSLVKPSNFKKYKRHDLVVEDWIDKDFSNPTPVEKKRDDGLNDIQRRNWELNHALVQELKEDCPSKCGGLWFYYKAHLLKDKNNPDVDISGLADHKDFCMHLEKKLKISILDKVFPRKEG